MTCTVCGNVQYHAVGFQLTIAYSPSIGLDEPFLLEWSCASDDGRLGIFPNTTAAAGVMFVRARVGDAIFGLREFLDMGGVTLRAVPGAEKRA
jgi:hypothetical protein